MKVMWPWNHVTQKKSHDFRSNPQYFLFGKQKLTIKGKDCNYQSWKQKPTIKGKDYQLPKTETEAFLKKKRLATSKTGNNSFPF